MRNFDIHDGLQDMEFTDLASYRRSDGENVFSNAWVLNTIEAICVALMVDGAGDPAIEAAQQAMRATLDA